VKVLDLQKKFEGRKNKKEGEGRTRPISGIDDDGSTTQVISGGDGGESGGDLTSNRMIGPKKRKRLMSEGHAGG